MNNTLTILLKKSKNTITIDLEDLPEDAYELFDTYFSFPSSEKEYEYFDIKSYKALALAYLNKGVPRSVIAVLTFLMEHLETMTNIVKDKPEIQKRYVKHLEELAFIFIDALDNQENMVDYFEQHTMIQQKIMDALKANSPRNYIITLLKSLYHQKQGSIRESQTALFKVEKRIKGKPIISKILYITRAKNMYYAGLFDDALRAFRDLLKKYYTIFPEQVVTCLKLYIGLCLLRKKEHSKALACFQEILKGKREVDALAYSGLAMLHLFKAQLKKSNDSSNAVQLELVDTSASYCREALALDASNQVANIALAEIYFMQRSYEKALFHSKVVLEHSESGTHTGFLVDAMLIPGKIHLLLGNDDMASVSFNQVVSLASRNIQARLGLAIIHFRKGEFEAAIPLLEALAKSRAVSLLSRFQINSLYLLSVFRKKKVEDDDSVMKAHPYIQFVLSFNPSFFDKLDPSYKFLGYYTLTELGRIFPTYNYGTGTIYPYIAAYEYLQGLERNGHVKDLDDLVVSNFAGVSEIKAGNISAAVKKFRHVTSVDENGLNTPSGVFVAAKFNLAQAYDLAGDSNNAINTLLEISAQCPKLYQARFKLGIVYMREQHSKGLAKLCFEAIRNELDSAVDEEHKPVLRDTIYYLGQLREQEYDYKGARELYRDLLDIDENSFAGCLGMAKCYLEDFHRRIAELQVSFSSALRSEVERVKMSATKFFLKALECRPNRPEPLTGVAVLLMDCKLYSVANKIFEYVATIDDSKQAIKNYANSCFRVKEFHEAIVQYQRIFDGNDPEFLKTIARVKFVLAREILSTALLRESIEHLTRASELSPQDRTIKLSLCLAIESYINISIAFRRHILMEQHYKRIEGYFRIYEEELTRLHARSKLPHPRFHSDTASFLYNRMESLRDWIIRAKAEAIENPNYAQVTSNGKPKVPVLVDEPNEVIDLESDYFEPTSSVQVVEGGKRVQEETGEDEEPVIQSPKRARMESSNAEPVHDEVVNGEAMEEEAIEEEAVDEEVEVDGGANDEVVFEEAVAHGEAIKEDVTVEEVDNNKVIDKEVAQEDEKV